MEKVFHYALDILFIISIKVFLNSLKTQLKTFLIEQEYLLKIKLKLIKITYLTILNELYYAILQDL